jgi:hypothetical protein
MQLYEQQGVDAAIILWVVGHLGVFAPNNLAGGSHQTQLTHIHFNNGTLSDHTQVGVQRTGRVLLDAQDVQVEGGLELGVGHMCPLHTQTSGADKPLVLGSLAGIAVAHKSDLGDHSLPVLLLALAALHLSEHLVIGNRLDLGDRDGPLASLLLSLLLDSVAENLGTSSVLTVQQVRGHGAVRWAVVVGVFVGALLVHVDGLLHGSLLLETLLVEELGAQTERLLGKLRQLVGLACLALAVALQLVHALSMKLLVLLHVLMLRHLISLGRGY